VWENVGDCNVRKAGAQASKKCFFKVPVERRDARRGSRQLRPTTMYVLLLFLLLIFWLRQETEVRRISKKTTQDRLLWNTARRAKHSRRLLLQISMLAHNIVVRGVSSLTP
jgi:hypothetical protein